MNKESIKLYGILGIVFLMILILSSCISAGLIAGKVAVDAAASAVGKKLATGEKVEALGEGQYLITVKAPALSLGERFKTIADETAHQNGYKTYQITSTSVSQGSDSGTDLSLLTGIIVCRR
jgi:Tfp pilus assembly protein PilX